MKKIDKKTFLAAGLTGFLTIACCIIFYFCFERITGLRSFLATVSSALMPVVWGIVVAYLLTPVYNYLHRNLFHWLKRRMREKRAKKTADICAMILSFAFLLFVVYALVAMIVPQVIDSVSEIVTGVPTYVLKTREFLQNASFFKDYPDIQAAIISIYNSLADKGINWINSKLDLDNLTTDYLSTLLPNIWSVLTNVSAGVARVVTFLKNLLVGLIIAVYLLAMKKTLSAQAKKVTYALVRKDIANVIIEEGRFAHKIFSGFISGKLLDSLIIGILCFIACSILNIPYPMLISVIIGVTNVIPFFGPFIGAIPSAMFILLLNPFKCLVFVIMILILQQIDGNIIGPKILGNSTGLSSFWVIFALLLFGGLFGFAGMLLGVPVFAILFHLSSRACDALLKKRGLSTATKEYELLESIQDDGYRRINDPAIEADIIPKSEQVETVADRAVHAAAEIIREVVEAQHPSKRSEENNDEGDQSTSVPDTSNSNSSDK